MAMDAVEIERLIKAHIPDAQVTIRDLAGDGETETGGDHRPDERHKLGHLFDHDHSAKFLQEHDHAFG